MVSLLKNDLKQLKNVIVIFTGLLVLCLAINLFAYRIDIPVISFYLIALVYAFVVPLVNLHYLFHQTQQTHFASLPFTKIQGFIVHYVSGLVCIIVPLFVYCIVEAVLGQGIVLENCMSLFLMIWIYYSLGNLTAYLTTTILVDLVLQVVIILAPIIMYICLWLVYHAFVRGIVSTDFSMHTISLLMPVFKLMICSIDGISWYYILLYLGYGLIIFIFSILACYYRGCDNNYHGYAFKQVGQIIKIVIIIAISWVVTSLFDVSSQSIKTFVMINVIATFIVTFVVQFIYSRKIRYVLCTVQAALIVLGTVSIVVCSKDYLENYIPSNIESVMIESAFGNGYDNFKPYKIKERESIEAIVAIHNDLLEQEDTVNGEGIKITYYRSNGDKTVREYYVDVDRYESIISSFNNSMIKSWLSQYYEILNDISEEKELSYNYSDNKGNDDEYLIEDASDILLFKNILQDQLTKFEQNPSLITKINRNQDIVYSVRNKNNGYSFGVQIDAPLDLAIKQYHKLKAN